MIGVRPCLSRKILPNHALTARTPHRQTLPPRTSSMTVCGITITWVGRRRDSPVCRRAVSGSATVPPKFLNRDLEQLIMFLSLHSSNSNTTSAFISFPSFHTVASHRWWGLTSVIHLLAFPNHSFVGKQLKSAFVQNRSQKFCDDQIPDHTYMSSLPPMARSYAVEPRMRSPTIDCGSIRLISNSIRYGA